MITYLKKIASSNFCKVDYYKEFIVDDKIQTVNIIEIEYPEEEELWSGLIDILTGYIGSDADPYQDVDKTYDWTLSIEYQIWEEPRYYHNNSFATFRVVIECFEGGIIESCYQVLENGLIQVDNEEPHESLNTLLNMQRILDMVTISFYRWNPRAAGDSVVYDFHNYFLVKHDKWCSQDKELYEQEMNAVLRLIRPNTFQELQAIPYGSERTGPRYRYVIYDENNDKSCDIRNMDDDFINFFYAYAEYREKRDVDGGCMGILLTDCYAPVYIQAYIKMLGIAFDKNYAQFFFVTWTKEMMAKLQRIGVKHINTNLRLY